MFTDSHVIFHIFVCLVCCVLLLRFYFSFPLCLFSVVSFVLVPNITLARLPVIHRIDHFSEVFCMKMKKNAKMKLNINV